MTTDVHNLKVQLEDTLSQLADRIHASDHEIDKLKMDVRSLKWGLATLIVGLAFVAVVLVGTR